MTVSEELYSGYDTFGDTLQHYGILGMKWGVRRYQNPDGSLTNAGKGRYGQGKLTKSKATKNREYDPSYAKAHDKSNNVKYMSDKDLKDINNRLNLEKQYHALRASEVSEGQRAFTTALKIASTAVAITGMALTLHRNAGQLSELGKTGLKVFNNTFSWDARFDRTFDTVMELRRNGWK